jgi:nitrogen regulatory protein P-II 1
MRLVLATVDPALVEAVRQALAEIQVTRLTVCDAHGYDAPPGDAIRQRAVLEIAVNDDFLPRTLERLAAVLQAGGGAADLLLVLPVEDVVAIHRDVRGPEAV